MWQKLMKITEKAVVVADGTAVETWYRSAGTPWRGRRRDRAAPADYDYSRFGASCLRDMVQIFFDWANFTMDLNFSPAAADSGRSDLVAPWSRSTR